MCPMLPLPIVAINRFYALRSPKYVIVASIGEPLIFSLVLVLVKAFHIHTLIRDCSILKSIIQTV